MANYTVPSVQIQQEFTQVPLLATNPLSALIVGPQYNIFSYQNNKAGTVVLNASDSGNSYAGASKTFVLQGATTAAIDTTSYEVWLDNVISEYAYTSAGIATGCTVVTNGADTTNTLDCPNVRFKAGYGASNNLGPSATILSRDAQPGDWVRYEDSTSVYYNGIIQNITYSPGAITYNGASTAAAAGHIAGSDGGDNYLSISGTYTGATSITYTVKITAIATDGSNNPTSWVVLSNGVDSSGPFTASSIASFPIGTFGLTGAIGHATTLHCTVGDTFVVAVVVGTPSSYDRIQLQAPVSGTGPWKLIALGVQQSGVNIPQYTENQASAVANWTVNTANPPVLTLNPTNPVVGTAVAGDVSVYLNGLNDASGNPLPMSVYSANVYLARREYNLTNVGSVGSLSDATAVAATLGLVDPINPLAQGVYSALLNSNGQPVYYTATGVPTDSTDASLVAVYSAALQLTRKSDAYYSIVPLTFNNAVQLAVQAHVNAMSNSVTSTSSPTRTTKWRIAWFSTQVQETSTIVGNETDGTGWTATVSGTTATVQTTHDTPNMQTAGVLPGDIFNYNFQLDQNNNTIYQSVAITAVPTQSTLTLASAIVPAVTPFKFTITRNLSSGAKAAALAAAASAFDDHRVRVVFPDVYVSGSTTLNGYYLAAALAGQRSGVAPHQSLTNYTVVGPTSITRTTTEFSDQDLDVMAAGGVWIVEQTVANGPAFTRHQLTTGEISGNLNLAEDSITTNTDSISYSLQDAVAPYIGIYNINAGAILKVRAAIDMDLTELMTQTYTETAGNQLNGYTINSIAQDTTFKDKLNCSVTLDEPAPMNHVKITITV